MDYETFKWDEYLYQLKLKKSYHWKKKEKNCFVKSTSCVTFLNLQYIQINYRFSFFDVQIRMEDLDVQRASLELRYEYMSRMRLGSLEELQGLRRSEYDRGPLPEGWSESVDYKGRTG